MWIRCEYEYIEYTWKQTCTIATTLHWRVAKEVKRSDELFLTAERGNKWTNQGQLWSKPGQPAAWLESIEWFFGSPCGCERLDSSVGLVDSKSLCVNKRGLVFSWSVVLWVMSLVVVLFKSFPNNSVSSSFSFSKACAKYWWEEGSLASNPISSCQMASLLPLFSSAKERHVFMSMSRLSYLEMAGEGCCQLTMDALCQIAFVSPCMMWHGPHGHRVRQRCGKYIPNIY